jgi:hypothetical protein
MGDGFLAAFDGPARVAEFLLNGDTGSTAGDTAQGNDGIISGAVWAVQH